MYSFNLLMANSMALNGTFPFAVIRLGSGLFCNAIDSHLRTLMQAVILKSSMNSSRLSELWML